MPQVAWTGDRKGRFLCGKPFSSLTPLESPALFESKAMRRPQSRVTQGLIGQ